ncbi:phosphoenolpyruvate--protein phosphotransferase [Halorhodospira halophila]|uniref:phosphoenolpyruvate--protein phosphotransferase n=1 Tax=Halorhodospira halophila (strain DSM 244 / SL1) TaxID=349124 RepID=A1WVE8_HALHL|nr:phosphoenolpyruvate--protein phosphotransferase [Halorhodospira halophila]ABM61660.1 PTSINtr with GAF domain, PtsP [Halorhodospira halophila SL1]MBK1729007.1 phosphoenolpyruvate-protein phosphotransferase PtsP [Halorhodospira halophila]
MLEILHRVSREVNAAPNLRQGLRIIVERVADAMAVDVCSVYLLDATQGDFVLMDTRGLNTESVGRVRLTSAEGLVGLVAEREEPINLKNAPAHSRFRYFPETGEERYSSFLGVPIIHYRSVLGVLVVQQAEERRFEENEVAFLVTLAAQLAGAIAHARASGGIHDIGDEPVAGDSRALRGLPGAPGVAIGTAVVPYAQSDLNAIPDRTAADPEAEVATFEAAVDQVTAELRQLGQQISGSVSADEQMLFDVYLRMLEGDSLVSETVERIRAGNWAPGALRQVIGEHVQVFENMDDPYLRERASDIRDLGRRILGRLRDEGGRVEDLPEKAVLVGHEVSASQLAEIPSDRLVGVVSATGSRNSHVAILARALGIPAVMGVDDLRTRKMDGRPVVVDGYAGRFYVDPTETVEQEYQRLIRDEAEFTEGLEAVRDEPAISPDGRNLALYANTGLISDINLSLAAGCDGIGLHRTEFPFLIRDRFPGEEEQADLYRRVLEQFAPKPVTLRTLDVGGDKSLAYFPIEEENPFLGWRGIRLTLDHPEIFLTQLRAMLRADVGLGNLQILLPMVSRLEEIADVRRLLLRARQELAEEGIQARIPPLGVMIEVPATIYQIDRYCDQADFLSLGSNDLTQYLLAVDRNNSRVAGLYDELHPAVLGAVQHVAQAARRHGKRLTVCGGMAGDPAGAILLMGFGIEGLSMSVSSLLRIKWVVRRVPVRRAAELANRAVEMDSPEEVRRMLRRTLEEYELGGLMRAGK